MDIEPRREAARAAADERATLARAADAARAALYVVEVAPDGRRRLVAGSPAFLALVEAGGSREAYTLAEIPIHPDDAVRVAAAWAPARLAGLVGTVVEETYRLLLAGGEVVRVHDRARIVPGAGDVLLVEGGVVDVSELTAARAARARAEADAVRARDLLEGAAEAAGKHLYVASGRGRTRSAVFLGPGLDRIIGRPGLARAEAFARFRDAVLPEDRRRLDDVERRAVHAAGATRTAVYRVRGLDGRTRHVRHAARAVAAGDAVLVEGAIEDVSEAHAAADRLRASEERVRAVIEHLPAAAVRVEGERVELNAAAERLLGRERDEIRSVDDWHRLVLPASSMRRVRGRTGEAVALAVVARDGTRRHVDVSGVRLGDGEVWLLVDVTRQVASDRHLREAHDRAAALAAEFEQLSRTDVLTGLPNRRHLTELAEQALAGPGGERVALAVVDIDRFKQINDRHGHAVGDDVLRVVGQRLESALRRRAGRAVDVVGRWGGEEFLVVLEGVASPAALAVAAERLRRAVAGSPVAVAGAGRLAVTVSVGAAWRGGLPGASLDGLVEQADRALYTAKRRGRDRAVLGSELGVEGVEPALFDAIATAQAMAVAASGREGVGEEHPRQVAELAARTAARLGLADDVVERTLLAGWLHDVGKTAIPDHVFQKPGPLDAEEWVVMRQHAEIGEQMVRRAGLEAAAPGVLHHHERWDGRGYPAGLAGAEIPIEARVVAAADAYSAITSRRHYQQARPHAEAVLELRRAAGTHLDPDVVVALVDVLGDADRG